MEFSSNKSRQNGGYTQIVNSSPIILASYATSAEEFDMNRLIALILILLSMVIQPIPHVHASGSAVEQQKHDPHSHVHFAVLWGGHSHDHEHAHHHGERSQPPASEECPHDADAVFVGEHTATNRTGELVENLVPTWQSCCSVGFTRKGDFPFAQKSSPPIFDLLHVPGGFSDVPTYLQGGAFRT